MWSGDIAHPSQGIVSEVIRLLFQVRLETNDVLCDRSHNHREQPHRAFRCVTVEQLSGSDVGK